MEEWEKKIINRNMNKLIETTICNAMLWARLLKYEILSSAEVSALKGLASNPCEQALDFYTLLQTRVNAFEALLEALYHTKQSGAAAILTAGLAQRDRAVDVLPISYHNSVFVSTGSNGTLVYKDKFGERDVAIKDVHIYIRGQTLLVVNVLTDRDTHETNKQEKSSKLQYGFGLAQMDLEGRRKPLMKLNKPIRGVLEKGEIGTQSKNQNSVTRPNKFCCVLM